MIRNRLGRIRRQFRYWLDDTRLAGPRVLRRLAHNLPDAFFIEIGANDGQMMDPLHKVIAASHWQGLALEPVPELFAQLAEHYAPIQERVRPINLAISTQQGILPFNCLRDRPGLEPLPQWAHGLGSFERDVIVKHADRIPDIENYIEQIDVPTATWEQLVQEQSVDNVDLLMVDTEGHDLMILRQIDLVRWRPSLVIFEHHHMSQNDFREAVEKFRLGDYAIFKEGLDTWALDTTERSQISRDVFSRLPAWIERSRYAEAIHLI